MLAISTTGANSYTHVSFSVCVFETFLSIHLPQHNINTPNNQNHIRDHRAAADFVKQTHVYEARGAAAHAVGNVRAVGAEIKTDLAARGFAARVASTNDFFMQKKPFSCKAEQ